MIDLAGPGSAFALFPLVAGDDAFALVADVDQDEVVVDAEHFAFDDLIDGDLLTAPVDVLGRGAFHCLREFRLPLVFAKIQTSN